jgi:ketosteroid isomerase-like protein
LRLSIAELAGHYHQGWADRSPDAIAALHTDDSTFHMHGVTDPAVGRGDVRELIASLLSLVPDLRFEAKRVYLGTDHIVFEYDMSGTSDGSPFVCDGVDVIAVTDGLVARKDTYLDLVALLDQVGTLPEMSAGVDRHPRGGDAARG